MASGGTATSAGAAGGGSSRNSRSPRPHATAAGTPLAKKGTSAPSRTPKWSSSCRGTTLPASAFAAMRTRSTATSGSGRGRLAQLAEVDAQARQRVQTEQRDRQERAHVIGQRVAHGPSRIDAVDRERDARRRLEYTDVSRRGRKRDPEPDDPLQQQCAFGGDGETEGAETHRERGRVDEPLQQRPPEHPGEPGRALQHLETAD